MVFVIIFIIIIITIIIISLNKKNITSLENKNDIISKNENNYYLEYINDNNINHRKIKPKVIRFNNIIKVRDIS
jgi:hypothetical protein